MSIEIMTTDAIDELVSPLRTALTRRDLIKKLGIGAGGLAVASVAGLRPDKAAAASPTSTYLKGGRVRIYKSGSKAKVYVYYLLHLSYTARKEIRNGVRYGIWFTLYNAQDSRPFHSWSS